MQKKYPLVTSDVKMARGIQFHTKAKPNRHRSQKVTLDKNSEVEQEKNK